MLMSNTCIHIIVEFPLFTVGLKNAYVQHWQMAHAHGKFILMYTHHCRVSVVYSGIEEC